MLNTSRSFFDQYLAPVQPADDQDPEHVLRLAIGALLLEMMNMDRDVWPEERDAVEEAIWAHFGLTEGEVEELLELAEAERADSTDYFRFTSLINGAYAPKQKIELVELLWRIAYANETLHKYEEHLVRKAAKLLSVPNFAFIAAKPKAGRR